MKQAIDNFKRRESISGNKGDRKMSSLMSPGFFSNVNENKVFSLMNPSNLLNINE